VESYGSYVIHVNSLSPVYLKSFNLLSFVVWDMFHTKFKYAKTQRAITIKLGSEGYGSCVVHVHSVRSIYV